MLFRLENRREGRSTHSGVLEFIADEGMVFMPYWMMQNLLLGEGDVLHVSSAALPKGSFVKLRPHTSDFLDITNPRAVLETSLRNFSCLSVGDTIPILYNNKRYFIDIVEAQPADAISVIETDCNVDFAPPLDYKEPTAPAASTSRPGAVAWGMLVVDGVFELARPLPFHLTLPPPARTCRSVLCLWSGVWCWWAAGGHAGPRGRPRGLFGLCRFGPSPGRPRHGRESAAGGDPCTGGRRLQQLCLARCVWAGGARCMRAG